MGNPSQDFHKLCQESERIGDRRNSGIIYYACPLFHEDTEIMKKRVLAMRDIVTAHISMGEVCFSPILYTNPFNHAATPPQGWYAFDLDFLKVSKSMVVVTFKGWKESKGVQMEIAAAYTLGIHVYFMSSHELKFFELDKSLIPDTKDELVG